MANYSWPSKYKSCFLLGASGSGQRKNKGGKVSPTNFSSPTPGSRLGGNIVLPNGGLTIRDPATGAQYVQIQLLQVRAEEKRTCSASVIQTHIYGRIWVFVNYCPWMGSWALQCSYIIPPLIYKVNEMDMKMFLQKEASASTVISLIRWNKA